MSVSFGDLVRRGREDAGLSQSRLATLVGRSATTIRAWENGRANPADRQAVAALAAVLGLDEIELLSQAGFEAPEARTRLSAREELTSLATERTEMIALASPVGDQIPAGATTAPAPEPDSDLPVDRPIPAGPAPEDQVVEIPLITVEDTGSDAPVPEAPVFTKEVAKHVDVRPAAKPRVVVTQQMAPSATQIGSNGFVTALSYVEDEAEKDFYRRRGAVTAVVLVFMIIVVWWAFGRTGSALGDFIESIIGSLDI